MLESQGEKGLEKAWNEFRHQKNPLQVYLYTWYYSLEKALMLTTQLCTAELRNTLTEVRVLVKKVMFNTREEKPATGYR